MVISGEVSNGADEAMSLELVSVDADFSEFFVRHKSEMMRLGYLMTSDGAQAEEAVQDAFAQVYRRWSHIDDHAAYMRRIVVNRCSSWHRHRAVVRRVQGRIAQQDSYFDQPDELADVLVQLPARRRAVLILRYYERRELSEIAETLGISIGTVKSTLHRALAQLKGSLSDGH
jgi:RNA polymerase sigma-70 factor (sigma-E family)